VLSAPHGSIIKIFIGERSHLIGQDLAAIAAHEIELLALETSGKIITNPPGDLQLHLGDNLLCFGEPEKIRATLLQTR
jgi:Trk K+ transport system NAD-binding subunit